MNEDFDSHVRTVDPDRWLSSRFVADAQARSDVLTIYAYDHELRRALDRTSNALVAEIRLAWWREVLDQIFAGDPVRRHPTAEALAQVVVRRRLPRHPLEGALDARLYALGGDRAEGETEAAQHVTEAACLVLDPAVDREAARMLGAAWARDRRTSEARRASRRISQAAFPAVAHATFAGRRGSELSKRFRLSWAVARGAI